MDQTSDLMAVNAFLANQGAPDVFLTASSSGDPRPYFPRRLVSYVLGMPAGEVRNPISSFVLMKADDL
jgi:hypothetical protein